AHSFIQAPESRTPRRPAWFTSPGGCLASSVRHILSPMALKDALLPEFDHEMATTRRLLERTPEAELGWQPHEKSMTLGQLAGHIANIPHWCGAVFTGTEFDVAAAGDDARPKAPASVASLLDEFDRKVKDARAGLAAR